jgi:hypothetical protein
MINRFAATRVGGRSARGLPLTDFRGQVLPFSWGILGGEGHLYFHSRHIARAPFHLAFPHPVWYALLSPRHSQRFDAISQSPAADRLEGL